MATIKSFTDFSDGALKVSYAVEPCNISQFRNTKEDIPCWSLVALFNVMPQINDWIISHGHKNVKLSQFEPKICKI